MKLNEIALVSLVADSPLIYDSYRANRQTGAFILIDPVTNFTSAVGMITEPEAERTAEASQGIVIDLAACGIAPEHDGQLPSSAGLFAVKQASTSVVSENRAVMGLFQTELCRAAGQYACRC